MKTYNLLTGSALALGLTLMPAFAETLSGQAVTTLMSGKSVSWVTPDSTWKGVSRYQSNGTASVQVTAPESFKDKGTWWVAGNKFCSKWGILRDGAERCSTIRTTNQDGVYRMDAVFIRVK